MENNISVRQWLEKFNNGDFNKNDRSVQCDAGWYDWFCDDNKLSEKTIKLGEMVKVISQSPKINIDTMYVWFKNNCPMSGLLYDDFRFADIESGDVIYTITPNSGHTGLAEVWGKENDFEKPIVEGRMATIYHFFGIFGSTVYDQYENESEDFEDEEDEDTCWVCGEYEYNCSCDDEDSEDEDE